MAQVKSACRIAFAPFSQMAADHPVPSDPPYEALASPTEVMDGELSEVYYPPSERSLTTREP